MHCKDNVIYLNRVDSAWVNGKVLVLDDGREEEAQIEGRVAQEPSNVQNKKIKIEAYDTASPEVEKHLQKEEEATYVHQTVLQQCAGACPWCAFTYLWVKRDGPRHKVYPSHNCNDDVEGQHVNNISWSHDITKTVGRRCMVSEGKRRN